MIAEDPSSLRGRPKRSLPSQVCRGLLIGSVISVLLLWAACPGSIGGGPRRSLKPACIFNLREIAHAKQAWAQDQHRNPGETPRPEDIAPFIKGGRLPTCPKGGEYRIGRVDADPICSVPGHELPSFSRERN